MSFFNKNTYPVLLVLIGLLWLFAFEYLTQMNLQGIIYPDSNSYRSAGENLYVFHRGDQYRPLLIAAICGVPYLFGLGADAVYEWSFWINIVFWLASLVVLFRILKSFCPKRVAFLLTLILLFSVGNTAYVFHLLTETIFTFMILLAFALMMRYVRDRRHSVLPWALSLLVLSILVKPGIQYFVVFAIAVFVRELWYLRGHRAMPMFYYSLALWAIQCAGLWYQVGNYTVSYIDAPTYYNYLGSRVEELKGGRERRLGYIYSLPMQEQKTLAKADMKRHITQDTGNFLKAYGWNLWENATTGNIAIRDCQNLENRPYFGGKFFFAVSKMQNMLFSVAGVIAAVVALMRWKTIGRNWSLVAMFVLYTILLSAISHSQGDRFTLVTYPFTILLVARLLKKSD